MSVMQHALEWLEQAGLALAYYCALLFVMRFAGKRLQGQVATFDLLVLITLGVVLQQTTLRPGRANACVFVITVFLAHRAVAAVCAHSRMIRHLVRGKARPLIWNGKVSAEALADEGLTYEDLLAGLRKLGHKGPERVRVAVLEETGHISVIADDREAQG